MKKSLPPIVGAAQLDAATFDADNRTVAVTFYSGAPVMRVSLFGEPHELEFEVSRKAAKLGRLNAGASVLDSHRTHAGIGSILGVVESARIENGEGRAVLRFSRRPDVEPVLQDIRDGVIRNVSMGTYLLEIEDVTPKGANLTRLRATSWEPYEISLVAVPADPGARVIQAADAEERPCRIHARSNTMRKRKKCPACSERLSDDVEETCPHCDADIEAAAAEQKKLKRLAAIDRIGTYFKLGDVWRAQMAREGPEDDLELVALASQEHAKHHPYASGPSGIGFGDDYESSAAKTELMAESVAQRARGDEPTGAGARYYGLSPAEMAIELLRPSRRHVGLDPRRHADQAIELASHTTSDYPLIFANALNKLMLPEYQAAMPTYRAICALRQFTDFRPHGFHRLGDFPDLLEVNEHGEIKYGSMGENREQVTAANYARIYSISRHMLVNDDMGAFADLSMKVGRRVANFENGLFYSVLTAAAGVGPTMSDTDPLFDSNHGNTGSGAIDVTNVGAGVAAMMKQTGIDGVKLNLEPAVLLTSPDRLAVARQFVSQNLRPTTPSEVNPFANLTALADANLATAAPWYLFAAPSASASAIYGYIGGASGPRVDSRAGWEIEGLEIRVSLDFGVGFIDYRGCYRSTGS